MEDKFLLEIGYELIHLVDKPNGELLDGISNLRKQKPHIPQIKITDNISLEPCEISINKERHKLNKNDNLVLQILNHIVQYVEKHPEIK